jgi:hypothetical protein
VARVLAIFTLVSDCVQQELAAESAKDDLVKLALHELVAVHLMHLVLASADCALTSETSGSVEGTLPDILLH